VLYCSLSNPVEDAFFVRHTLGVFGKRTQKVK
jgi:hypothetical protein